MNEQASEGMNKDLGSAAFWVEDLYMTTGKNIVFTIWTFVGKVMSLLFDTLSRFVIAFIPFLQAKYLQISFVLSLCFLLNYH